MLNINISPKIPTIGFLISSLLLFSYGINLLIKGYVDISLIIFATGAINSVVTFGLYKRKKWAYKVGILLAILSLVSLLSRLDVVEIIIAISGIILFLSKKNFK